MERNASTGTRDGQAPFSTKVHDPDRALRVLDDAHGALKDIEN